MQRKTKKGFTIVELVIVIAVIGVLTAILVPTFISLTAKANKASDQSLVANLNTALKMQEAEDGEKNPTMHDAVLDLEKQGYKLSQLISKSGQDLVWNIETNEFELIKNQSGVKYWKIYKNVPAEDKQNYSIYAGHEWAADATSVGVKVGFDAGYNENIATVNYANDNAQEVVIRTNGGNLTVDAPLDTVKHYGEAQVVNLTAVGTSSYYENGSVGQVNIKKGRLVLTNNENASVETVYLQATGETYDNIILATQSGAELPELIARDNVPLPEGTDTKTVVTIQTGVNEQGQEPSKVETINLYSESDVKESTNGYDVSELGQLVVEAISEAGQAQAAEQISDPEVIAKVTESKAAVEVKCEAELTAALTAKAKYIIVTDSFDTTKAFLIQGSTTIEGAKLLDGTYPIITSKATTQSEKRGFRISASNIDVNFRNLSIDVRTNVASDGGYPRGLQIDSSKTGIKLSVDNCNISATHYAFNVCNGAEVSATFINSHLLGYGSLNLWNASYLVSVDNCILEGVQNNKESFAVVILEGDTTGETSLHSSAITVDISNTKFIGTCNNTAGGSMAFIGFNTNATANTVKMTNCTFEKQGEGIVKSEYDLGTANKVLLDDASYSKYHEFIDNTNLYKFDKEDGCHTVIAKTVYTSQFFDSWDDCLAAIYELNEGQYVGAYVNKDGKYYYKYVID